MSSNLQGKLAAIDCIHNLIRRLAGHQWQQRINTRIRLSQFEQLDGAGVRLHFGADRVSDAHLLRLAFDSHHHAHAFHVVNGALGQLVTIWSHDRAICFADQSDFHPFGASGFVDPHTAATVSILDFISSASGRLFAGPP